MIYFYYWEKKPTGFNKPFIKDKFDFQAPIKVFFQHLVKLIRLELLISIDLPLMTPKLIKKIWQSGNKSKNAIVPKIGDYLQPVCAFYHRKNYLNLKPNRKK
ncbi:MAG: hypothetical protein CM1200mP1_04100 [Candidatus Neomarinimicrobiota bacterium]|nr:MAG: hypothetical protein CM1200mP1_04100 [Candidatus Neomarinimicrobiota bacterium]